MFVSAGGVYSVIYSKAKGIKDISFSLDPRRENRTRSKSTV